MDEYLTWLTTQIAWEQDQAIKLTKLKNKG